MKTLNGAARFSGSVLLAFVTYLVSPASHAQSLSGWQNADVGAVGQLGNTSSSNGTFTVNGSGVDIWGNGDEFHYAYQAWSGDGEFVARVNGVANTHGWAKAGIMLREALTSGSRHAFACVNPSGAPAGIFRTASGGASSFAPAYQNFSPMWLKLVRVNTLLTAYYSSNGTTWQMLGSETLALPTTVFVGLAVTSHNDGVLCAATFDNIAFRSASHPLPTAPTNLTATATGNAVMLRWADNSSNETRFQIEKSTDNSTFSFDGFVNADVTEYTSNYLQAYTTYYFRVRSQITESTFAYSNVATATTGATPLAAPGLTAVPVSSQQIDLHWTDGYASETGFELYRSADNVTFTLVTTASANTTQFSVNGLTPATWYYFRVRVATSAGVSPYSDSAPAQTLSGPPGPPPAPAAPSGLTATAANGRIDLAWTDNATNETEFHCERSLDNVNFFSLGAPAANATSYSDTTGENGKTYFYRIRAVAGLAMSAFSNIASATALASTTPAPDSGSWSAADVGAVGVAGSSTVSGNEMTVTGAGADIWGSVDAFRFGYRAWTGNGQIVVRVEDMDATHGWAKAGVMFRESLSPNSANVFAYLTPINGAAFQSRAATSNSTQFTAGPWWIAAPYWLKLVRNGDVFTAHTSTNGTDWTLLSSATVSMLASIYVGLAVTSHNASVANTATFMQSTIVP